MSQLIERQPKAIFSFPGLVDRSVKKEVVIEPVIEEKKEEEPVVKKNKGGRPRKDKVASEEAPKTSKKGLSLTGKIY